MDLITVIRVSGRLVHDQCVLASVHEDLEIQVGQGGVGDARNFLYGGGFLWLVYGTFIHSLPVILANLITFILAMAISILRIRYGA